MKDYDATLVPISKSKNAKIYFTHPIQVQVIAKQGEVSAPLWVPRDSVSFYTSLLAFATLALAGATVWLGNVTTGAARDDRVSRNAEITADREQRQADAAAADERERRGAIATVRTILESLAHREENIRSVMDRNDVPLDAESSVEPLIARLLEHDIANALGGDYGMILDAAIVTEDCSSALRQFRMEAHRILLEVTNESADHERVIRWKTMQLGHPPNVPWEHYVGEFRDAMLIERSRAYANPLRDALNRMTLAIDAARSRQSLGA